MKKKRTPIPQNWVVVSNETKNLKYRCPITDSTNTMQCTFTGRASQIRQHLEEGKHTFEIINSNKLQPKDEETLDNMKIHIEQLVIEAGGFLQLSLSQISSSAFTMFIQKIITSIGLYIQAHPNEIFHPETFYPGISRNKAKALIISHANDKAKEARQNLRMFSRDVALTIDAGTIQQHGLLEFHMIHAASGQHPCLLASFPFIDHSAHNFFTLLREAITKATCEDFTIVAIVADNVSYQKKTLAHWNPESFINTIPSDDPLAQQVRGLIYITCCCHDLDLVITHMIKNNHMFKKVTTAATLLAAMSRRHEYAHYFTSKAPNIPATRWLFLYEFTNWVLKNKDSIIPILDNIDTIVKNYNTKKNKYSILKNMPFNDFQKVNILLQPLRQLNDNLEKDSCTLCYVVPLVEECASKVRKIISDPIFAGDATPLELLHVFTARFRKTAIQDYLCLSFALTSEGRFILGTSPNASAIDRQHDETNFYHLTGAPTEIFAKDYNNIDDKIKYREALNRYIDQMIRDMNRSCYQNYREELSKLQSKNTIITSVFEDKYVQARQALAKHLARLGYDSDKRAIITKQFKIFIHDRSIELRKRLDLYLSEEPFMMWKNLSAANLFKELADYAIKWSAVPASEASVERLFSLVKKYLSTRQRSSVELIDAYVNLIPAQTKNDIISSIVQEPKEEMTKVHVAPKQSPKKPPQQMSLQNYFSQH